MIISLFLPQRFKGYYLVTKRIVTISFSKHSISALYTELYARTKTIENYISEVILLEQFETPELAYQSALKNLIKKLPAYDELILTIPNSTGIFKEVSIPLLDIEKIRQIVGFELENYLPFPLSSAVYDFVVTNTNRETQTSTILITAIPREKIEYYVQLFKEINIPLTSIKVNSLSIYNLYTQIDNKNPNNAELIVVYVQDQTILLYFENAVLKKIRSLSETMRAGTDEWYKAIEYTLESCTENWVGEKHIILYGNFSNEIINKAKATFLVACTSISTQEIIENLHIKNSIQDASTIPLELVGFGLDFKATEDFNLIPSEYTLQLRKKTIANYIFIVTLLLSIYGSLGIHTFFEIKKFSSASESLKTDIMKKLKIELPSLKAKNPSDALRRAKTEITKEENIWFSFSSQTKHSFLTYLFDLSTLIDRQTLGLDLKKMIFNKNGIILEGNVKSFDAVEEFIKQLKNTHLFTQVPNLQKTDFVMSLIFANHREQS